MGKPSIPEQPKAATTQELANATVETAEHMARLQRAMEFGEPLLKHTSNEDGSSTRYELTKSDREIPEGAVPKYEDREVKSQGPTSILVDGYSPGPTFDPSGNLRVPLTTYNGDYYPKGTNYSEVRKGLATDPRMAFQGSQEITSTNKVLLGHTVEGDDWSEFIPVGKYYRIDKAADGTTTRTAVDRDEAIHADFSGMGDIGLALKRWEFEKKTSGEVADHLLSQARKYGLGEGLDEPGFIDTAVEMLARSDPIGDEVRQLAGRMAADYEPGTLPELPEIQKMVDPALMERAGIAPVLPEVGIGDVPKYERAGEIRDLDRLGKEPTLEKLARGEAPDLGRVGEMDRLGRAGATPEFGQIGAGPSLQKAGEMDGLGRIGAGPTMQELGAGPELERAGEMARLGQLGEFGGYERAGEMGPLELAREMGPLERRGAGPTLAELGAGPSLERAGEMGDLERLAAFGGLERAGAMGGIERAGEMAALERAGAAPTLERLAAGDIPEIPIDPESLAGRQFAERQFLDRAQSGRTAQLMGKRAQRLARGRAAGLGNIFGGGAVIEEAAQVQEAEDAAQRAAMGDLTGFLQSGQTAGDYQARVAQQNLQNRLLGIQQRTGAATGEFGMGMQRLGADREAALQERVQYLSGLEQRTGAEMAEYQAGMQTLESNRRAGEQEYGLESQRRSFANEQTLREQASKMETLGLRTEAERAEYDNLQRQLTQINATRQAQFGMGGETLMANRQAQLQEQASRMETMGQRTGAQRAEFEAQLQAMGQRTAAAGGEYGFEAQRIDQQNAARLQEQASRMETMGIRTAAELAEYQNLQNQLTQINTARQAQFGMEAQGLGINQQAQLQERADQLGAMKQRTDAQQTERKNLLAQIEQNNAAMERTFGADIKAAGFDNEATLREREQKLAGVESRTKAENLEFENLGKIVSQMNQAMTSQFGMEGQRVEFNNMQRMRERQDELGAMASRNQAEEAEFRDLLSTLGQQAGTRQAQYGLEMQGIQQRNVAGDQDFQRQQQVLAQQNLAAQQSFTNAMQKAGTQEQMKQQKMANLQSLIGQAPVASQFGMLPGAQQAAQSSFTPLQYQRTDALGILGGQQNLAANTFGTQGQMWGQQAKLASQPSGFGQVLGTVAGGFAGGAGAAWGKSKWEPY